MDAAPVCDHCKAPVSGTKRPLKPLTATSIDSPTAGGLDDQGAVSGVDVKRPRPESGREEGVVLEEMERAVTSFKAGDGGLTLLFCRNALALNLLTEVGREKRSKMIQNLYGRSGDVMSRSKHDCLTCDGGGKRILRREGLDGETIKLTSNLKCKVCFGKGFSWGKASMADRAFAQGAALKRYNQLQNARRYVPVGLARIPSEWDGTLDTREVVLLKRAIVRPCDGCHGFGRIACKECKNSGYVRCDAEGCEGGIVEIERSKGLGGSDRTSRVECKVCKGSARMHCEECRGQGSGVCDECDGSGEPSLCKTCNGQGMSDCKYCRGTGVYKGDLCERCQGKRRSLCSKCDGSGHDE